MANGPLHRVIDGIRALVGDPESVADGQLLDAFVAHREEAAFAELVRRHGPMVMGVCRRIVEHFADAQDAFQATFLTLARKASSVSPREMVGNWLYGVAYRTALEARGKLARLRAREKQVENMPELKVEPEAGQRELLRQLDHELSRLPDKYRVPVVLCELEGRSRKDVAERLRLPEGTLSSRLATARKLLADRLGRRGLTLSAAGWTALLAQQTADAAVTSALVASTTQLATLSLAVNASAAGNAALLSEGVIHAMFMSKLKVLACSLAAFCLFSVGLAYLAHTAFGRAEGVSPLVEPSVSEPLHGTPGGSRPPLATQTEKTNAPAFTRIHLKTGKAAIRQTGKESFAIKGGDASSKLARAVVVDGVLELSSPVPDVEFVVECRELSKLTVEGVTTVEVADLKTKRLEIETSAVGQTTLSGTAEEQIITVNGGAAKVDGSACKGKRGTVLVSGAGQVIVNVSDQLKVTISVSGQVEYLGSPAIEKNVHIAGKLSQRQTAGDVPHAPTHQTPPPKAPAAADPPIEGALKLTAEVDGFTQGTQFNMQKYPFKYTGVSALTTDQLRDLPKAGDLPDATAKALLGCLLWPKANDSLQNLALKSDGKKLTGKAEVLHKYGQQGTHVLKLRVEGTMAGGQVTLQILEPTVSGSWNWGGGTMQLAGKVQIAIKCSK